MLNLPPRFVSQKPDSDRPAESPVAWIGHLSTYPLIVAGFFLAGMHELAWPVHAALWVRWAVLWVLMWGLIRGHRWSWAPTIILSGGYCLVATLIVSASLLVQFQGPNITISTIPVFFWSVAALSLLAAIVLTPAWLAFGGAAFVVWRHWECFGVVRHERYRLLVMQGLPVATMSLFLDAPLIASLLSERPLG